MGEWRDLHDGWRLDYGEGVPATVPGCVHTDLLAASLIPDPYLDRNEEELRWIGRTDWRYRTEFDWQPDENDHVDLVCEGLDTVATLTLNGQVIGTTQNMHRTYRFAIRSLLRAGSNELIVDFASPETYAAEQKERLGELPGPNTATPEPFNFIRKMACNFGWDWGPVLVTAGIWKPIRLHSWRSARLASVRPHVTVDAGTGRIAVDVDLDVPSTTSNVPLTVAVEIAGERAEAEVDGAFDDGRVSTRVEVEVPSPDLWWPHTLGEQPLYELEVELRTEGSTVLDQWTRKVGFRSLRLETGPDELGAEFTIVVNDVPIFSRGANWIPDDCFPSRVDAERYRTRLEQARRANVDLLRVWGGGLYEKDEFYTACDELGILVWQDFLFACASYPEEAPFGAEVEEEARDNVVRLMPHPSLALWNGNNENLWGAMEWGWEPKIADRTWGSGFYFDVLPRVVAELDPGRPYWPGSPYAGTMDLPVNADNFGCSHIWDVWNLRDYPIYRAYVPRFVSEFGWQGPPTWSTLTRAIHDDPLTPESPGVLAHQKAYGGNDKLATGLAPHFPPPDSFEDWHWAMQLNQARAIDVGIAHFRSYRGRCMGTVVWQLNDCWPVTSWAMVDGDGREKPLWHAIRKVYDDRLVTVQPRGTGGLHAVLVNDAPAGWSDEVAVARMAFSGEVLASWSTRVEVDAMDRTEIAIPADLATPGDPRREFLLVTCGDRRTTWFFEEDKHLAYPAPAYDVEISGTRVTVTARSLLRDLALLVDRVDPKASVDDMLVTLLPGESRTFTVEGIGALPVELPDGAVRTANDLVVRTVESE